MLKKTQQTWWKSLLLSSGIYITVVLGIIVVTFWLADGEWGELSDILGSYTVWITIVIGLALVLIANTRYIFYFIPVFLFCFGIFMVASSVYEDLAVTFVDAFDINLFGVGVALAALGIAFWQLFNRDKTGK